MHIDYASLIWDDMIYQSRQFESKAKYKVAFVRYTKLLISHFIMEDPTIDRRFDEKYHSEEQDHILTRLRTHSTNTTRRGRRIPEFLLSDVVKETEAYKTYDVAEIAAIVGVTEAKKKIKTIGIGRGRGGKKVSDSISVTRKTKKKTTLRDEELTEQEKGEIVAQEKLNIQSERERLIKIKKEKLSLDKNIES